MINPIVEILTGEEPVVEWIVPDLIPKGTLIQYAGDPNVGKSFFAYQLAMAIAGGVQCLDYRPQKPTRTLYCDVENSRPDRDQYLRWGWVGLNRPAVSDLGENLWLSHFELGRDDWAAVLLNLIRQHQPGFIVIDTASAAFAIKEENDNAEGGRIITTLRELQRYGTENPSFLILRHRTMFLDSGHPRKARGAQVWKGATDATWFHERKPGPLREGGLKDTCIIPDKVRAFGLREQIDIEPVELLDANGKRRGIHLRRVKRDD